MAIPWDLIEQNVKAYIQTDEYHSQEMVNIKLVDEIVNGVNTSGTTVFNNPVSISKLPLLASLMSSQNTISDIQKQFIDSKINTDIDIQAIIGNKLSEYMPNMDEINSIKKNIEDEISFYTDKLDQFKNDGISATSEIYKKFENELTDVQNKLNAISGGDYSSLINMSSLSQYMPNIDVINDIQKKLMNQISFYNDKLDGFIRDGISETSDVYKQVQVQLSDVESKFNSIVNGDYSSLMEDITQSIQNISIPIELSLGVTIDIKIPNIPDYQTLYDDIMKFVVDLMQFKSTLSLPNIDIMSMLKDLLPDIDLISPVRKIYEDEISFYTDKLEDFKKNGISEMSEIYKKFEKELEDTKNKLISEIDGVQNLIADMNSISFPDVNEIYNKILKTGNDIVASTAQIIPVSSAIPGGMPISEQVTYPGIGEPFEFGTDSGKDFVKAYIDMIRTQLENASITNVSNYNNVITPISSVGIV